MDGGPALEALGGLEDPTDVLSPIWFLLCPTLAGGLSTAFEVVEGF